MSDLRSDIEAAINRNSAENGSNTPDFILAEYLTDCLAAFDKCSRAREKWRAAEEQLVNLRAQVARVSALPKQWRDREHPRWDPIYKSGYECAESRCADELSEALVSVSRPPSAPPWRPMESAPRDGSPVLLRAPQWRDYPTIGTWCERVGAWEADAGVMEDGPSSSIDGLDGPDGWLPLPAMAERPPEPQQEPENCRSCGGGLRICDGRGCRCQACGAPWLSRVLRGPQGAGQP